MGDLTPEQMALLAAEEKLNKALADFERDAEQFRKCRAFTYFTCVQLSAQRLLDASDNFAAARKAAKDARSHEWL